MKENVLKVKIILINEKYSYLKIIEQDCEVLKRDIFKFKASNNIKIHSVVGPTYIIDSNSINRSTFYIWGSRKDFDDLPVIVPNQDIPKIEEAIKELNEKYGTPKPWRAKKGERYYWIGGAGQVIYGQEDLTEEDLLRYQSGNYFRIEKQAELASEKRKELFKTLHKEFGE